MEGNPIIHIHAQQVDARKNGEVINAQFTKNERGMSKGGRYFPLSKEALAILNELQLLQESKSIQSEFIFCDEAGEWVNVKQYSRALKTICKKLGLVSKGTYAFRRDVNATMYASGLDDMTRGRAILNGPRTNIEHYIHARSDYAEQARIALNSRNQSRSIQVQTM